MSDDEKQSKHRGTLHEDRPNDDVKAFNDNILFNSRPMTPTRANKDKEKDKEKEKGSSGGFFKMPGWLRGKSDPVQNQNDKPKPYGAGDPPQGNPPSIPPKAPYHSSTAQPTLLTQTETAETPNIPNEISPRHSLGSAPPPFSNLPPLLQSQTSILGINKSKIVMKTIFVPGVPINSVKFNENGQRLAYSTNAGVIQVYQFPINALPNFSPNSADLQPKKMNENKNDDDDGINKKKEKLSPKLLHTFCVSKPNEILQLCWDTMNDNRLFIAIGNPNKNDDHIQVWNVGAKKCEYIISFNNNNYECSCIEYIKCNPSFSHHTKSSNNNRLIVSGYKYKDPKDKSKGYQSILYLYNDQKTLTTSSSDEGKITWNLISKSNMMETLITCVEFNHNGKIIIVGGYDGYIRMFDIKNGDFTQLTKWNAHYGKIQSIHLCDDANSIISIGNKDFIVKHWQLNNENSCKKIWRLKDENKWKLKGMDTRASIANYDDDDNDIIPLLCLGPKNFFAVTEPQPRYHGNESGGGSSISPSKSGSIKEDGENDDNTDNSINSNTNINTDTMIYNVMIKNIDDKNDSYSGQDNTNNANNKITEDIVVGGHSKIITAIDWHKESQMLATCSVDGTLRIFEVFRH